MSVTFTSNRSALVTGSTRGIGLGIASHLAEKGWSLTLTARNEERLQEVANNLRRFGGEVQILAADMSDDSTPSKVLGLHESSYGSLNALVLAAGVGSAGPLAGYSIRRFDKQFAVNIRAPFNLITQALPHLRHGARIHPARLGRIVAMASLEGVYPESGLSAYGASKAALISLLHSVNLEEGASGVVGTAISPGFVDTDMSAWVSDRIPPESMIPVSDIVKVVDLVLGLSANAVLPHVVINRSGASAYEA
jgi:3-oxoacyl-[acyl-carrier protein] reductase